MTDYHTSPDTTYHQVVVIWRWDALEVRVLRFRRLRSERHLSLFARGALKQRFGVFYRLKVKGTGAPMSSSCQASYVLKSRSHRLERDDEYPWPRRRDQRGVAARKAATNILDDARLRASRIPSVGADLGRSSAAGIQHVRDYIVYDTEKLTLASFCDG